MQALLIEDEEAVRLATAQTLELAGFQVQSCVTVEQGLPHLSADFAGIVVSDVRLPGLSGLGLLAKVTQLDADLPVILITGHGDISMAVAVMRGGAYDFIEKPYAAERLQETALRAQEKRRLVLENRGLRLSLAARNGLPELIGSSPQAEKVRHFIRNIGPTEADVLIRGATGTGKEVAARHLHAASGRRGEFVAINCGALPESMFESEIFGHEAGAFTGAHKRRIGKLEHAQGGTVFLDEIESMPLVLQVKLLRVLQERRLERLGGNAQVALDCRVIAASKVDLLQWSAEGRFREDLYYRLSVVSLDLPRLSERRQDIPQLLAHFIQHAALRYQKPVPSWSMASMEAWQQRDWPGNVRELRNFADQLVLGVAEALPAPAPTVAGGNASLPEQVDAYESALIAQALQSCAGNVALASERLGIPKKTLYDKLKKYGLGPARQVASENRGDMV
jgi:two-component system C4-dicarboxylate transport response regulator DctD